MALTAHGLLLNADTFRRAYPNWPHAEPMPSLRSLAIEMATQHRDAGMFLVCPSQLLGLLDPAGTAAEGERQSAWDAYWTIALAAGPLADEERYVIREQWD